MIFSGSRWCCDLSGWTKAWLWIWWLCHILRSTGTNKITAESLFFLPSSLLQLILSFFLPSSHPCILPCFFSSLLQPYLTLVPLLPSLPLCYLNALQRSLESVLWSSLQDLTHTVQDPEESLEISLDYKSEDPQKLLQEVLGGDLLNDLN